MKNAWVKTIAVAATLAVIGTAPSLSAQEALKVKTGKAWTHKHSGITVPATLGGQARSDAAAYAADQLDIGLQFTAPNADESLSVYIYRNTNGAVPLWFAQAQWAVENRDIYGKSRPVSGPEAFVPPGQSVASGLRATFTPSGPGGYQSTGIVLLPVGDWYVKLRASSRSRSPEELGQWMATTLGEIGWPKATKDGPVATPMTDCATSLAFDVTAKDAPKDGAASLLSGMLGMMVADKTSKPADTEPAPPATWCRDAVVGQNQASYRANAASDGYLLAIGDNGNAIAVGPDAGTAIMVSSDPAKAIDARFSITLMTAAQNVSFVAQDRLPSPQRVIQILGANRRVMTVPTWGKNKNIQIDSGAF